jgi:hypothetical protein
MSAFPSRAIARALSISFTLFLATAPSAALAASVYVAANGADSGSCGAKDAPCRSISQGIANSAVGGSVVVGPGRYGDLDDDGVLGETGEEPVPGACAIGDDCLIHVNKQVTVTSQAGAFATVIDPGPILVEGNVYITAPGAVFGGVNRGFTIVAPRNAGSLAILAQTALPGATIAGNVLVAHEVGSYGVAVYDGQSVLSNRIVVPTGGTGIYMGSGNTIASNTVSGADFGLYVDGIDNAMSRNVLTNNAYGAYVVGDSGNTITESSFLANHIAGVAVTLPGLLGSITDSNIVGNAADTPSTNCGLDNNFSGWTAKNVWWGAAAGPGSDPADQACDVEVGATTPFATSPFKVKVKGIR